MEGYTFEKNENNMKIFSFYVDISSISHCERLLSVV